MQNKIMQSNSTNNPHPTRRRPLIQKKTKTFYTREAKRQFGTDIKEHLNSQRKMEKLHDPV